jgi:hypothetical protein
MTIVPLLSLVAEPDDYILCQAAIFSVVFRLYE